MDFPVPRWMLPVAVAAAGIIFSAGARGGESIIFSSPQNGETSNAPSLTPKPSSEAGFARELRAPQPLFAPQMGPARLPPPQPAVSPAQQQRLHKLLEQQNDWAFLTPDEILGVKSQNSDDAEQDDRTPMERYLDRQEQLRNRSVTNSYSSNLENQNWESFWNSSGTSTDSFSQFASRMGGDLGRLLSSGQKNINLPEQIKNSPWTLFNSPRSQRQTSKADLTRQTAAEQFQQLLNPSLAPAASANNANPDNNLFSTPKVTLDPNINQPEFKPNPLGASFIPITSGIGKPTGLNPLPGVVTPNNSQPVVVPAWAPQMAPWLLQGPQPFTVPQRKF